MAASWSDGGGNPTAEAWYDTPKPIVHECNGNRLVLQVLFLQPGAVFQKGGIDMMPGMDGFLQGGRGRGGREGKCLKM